MSIIAECQKVRVLDGGDASGKHLVQILDLDRLAVMELSPARCGPIDPRFTQVRHEPTSPQIPLDAPKRPSINDVLHVHVAMRTDIVLRWQKVSTEDQVAA